MSNKNATYLKIFIFYSGKSL